jgi:WD40 repeat protein
VLQRLRLARRLEAHQVQSTALHCTALHCTALHCTALHQGCVNTVAWNRTGTLLLSGSDDHRLVITDPFTFRRVDEVLTGHRANIFSAHFLPDTADLQVVSIHPNHPNHPNHRNPPNPPNPAGGLLRG